MADIVIQICKDPGRSGRERLLMETLRAYAAEHGIPAPQPGDIVRRDANSKPSLRSGAPEFSVSHSGDYWSCAVSRGVVGLDIQLHTPCDCEKIARRFFTPEEQTYLRERGEVGFFELWTAKESYIKWRGSGLDELRAFSVVRGGVLCAPEARLQLRLFDCLPGYGVCLCAEDTRSVAVRLP